MLFNTAGGRVESGETGDIRFESQNAYGQTVIWNLSDAAYMPQSGHNILSVSQLLMTGFNINFKNTCDCVLWHSDDPNMVFKGKMRGKLFYFEITPSVNECNVSQSNLPV